jgi:tRNA threonylcarbamoyladenosine biosynthesis protein TsaE
MAIVLNKFHDYFFNGSVELPVIFSLEELPLIVRAFLKYSIQYNYGIVTFAGDLGSGKTTFVREFLRQLGVAGVIASPTFTYVNIYRIKPIFNEHNVDQYYDLKKHTIYHFDAYRIKQVNDFFAHGFDEYLVAPSSMSIIEWPEVIQPLLSLRTDVCRLELAYVDEERRALRIVRN